MKAFELFEVFLLYFHLQMNTASATLSNHLSQHVGMSLEMFNLKDFFSMLALKLCQSTFWSWK